MKYISIANITAEKPRRITTGEPELDWLYGKSEFPEGTEVGIPVKTISTWCGEGGVGKSRLAIKVARYKVQNGSTVLYFQNEVDLPTLASWVKGNTELDNFYCSEVTALNEQVEIIKELKPDLVFIDSINLVDEFGTGTARSIKKIIDAFRGAIRETGSHVVILCQLNKQNEATGSTALGHLPDTNLVLTNYYDAFKVSIGKKNRYGPKGSKYFGIWEHLAENVRCISNNRYGFMQDVSTESVSAVGPMPPFVDAVGPMPIVDHRHLDLSEFHEEFDISAADTKLEKIRAEANRQQLVRLAPVEAPVEPEEPKLDSEPKYSLWNPKIPYGNWGLLGRLASNLFRLDE